MIECGHPSQNPIYITAEIGQNHNGSLETALRLIDAAKAAGVNAVKFQKRVPKLSVPKWMQTKDYMDHRRKLEFGTKEYDEINEYCDEVGIDWYASVWDVPSLDFIMDYHPFNLKVPSAKLTDLALLKSCAETKIHTFISTGMSTMEEIEEAVDCTRDAKGDFTLLHCNSAYPARNRELNLKCIPMLARHFMCGVGYSGHEFGLLPTVIAVTAGAIAIERHLTLDRTQEGTDHMCSIEPAGFMKLVGYIRTAKEVMGDGKKVVYPSERKAMERLR